MPSVTLQQAKASLAELIHGLRTDEEIVISENGRPIARLIRIPAPSERKGRQLGTLRGTVVFVADDFDAPLDDLREYMR